MEFCKEFHVFDKRTSSPIVGIAKSYNGDMRCFEPISIGYDNSNHEIAKIVRDINNVMVGLRLYDPDREVQDDSYKLHFEKLSRVYNLVEEA